MLAKAKASNACQQIEFPCSFQTTMANLFPELKQAVGGLSPELVTGGGWRVWYLCGVLTMLVCGIGEEFKRFSM